VLTAKYPKTSQEQCTYTVIAAHTPWSRYPFPCRTQSDLTGQK